jgi:hypothetical protein
MGRQNFCVFSDIEPSFFSFLFLTPVSGRRKLKEFFLEMEKRKLCSSSSIYYIYEYSNTLRCFPDRIMLYYASPEVLHNIILQLDAAFPFFFLRTHKYMKK